MDQYEEDSFIVVDEESEISNDRFPFRNIENSDKPDALLDESLCSSENEIIENALKKKKKSKLRKKNQEKINQKNQKNQKSQKEKVNLNSIEDGEINSINEEENEEDNFIENENENDMMDEDNYYRNNMKILKEKSLAHEIFCNKNEEEEFRAGNPNPNSNSNHKKNLKIDPLDLSEFVLSDKENELINADVPERIFLKYQDER